MTDNGELQNAYGMKPEHTSVVQYDVCPATIPTFCVKTMILSVLMDNKLMNSNNITKGYAILTGREVPKIANNSNYGEIQKHGNRLCHIIVQIINACHLVL